MKDTMISNREHNRIVQIASEYRQNGYTVIVHPLRNELPNFLSNYRPDIIATNDNESVIIEVASHSNMSKELKLSQIAEIIEAQPNWRFEVVVSNPKGDTLVSSESRLPNIMEVSKRLTKAKRLVKKEDYEAAIVTAWSAAEGLMRLVGKAENIALDRRSSSYVMKNLYSLGLVGNLSYQELFDVYKMRNSVTHGLVEPNLQSSTILNFIDNFRSILNRFRGRLRMCKCPVCGKRTSSVGTLFSHLVNIHDPRHEEWLESYCESNNINFGKLLVDRVKEIKDANRPLTDSLKRDFCGDC